MRERGVVDVVKLASNENPRGPGAGVRKALANADLSRYPDGSGFRLKRALAEHLGVGTDRITLGNGSNDRPRPGRPGGHLARFPGRCRPALFRGLPARHHGGQRRVDLGTLQGLGT